MIIPNRSAAPAGVFIMVILLSETFAIQVLLVLHTVFPCGSNHLPRINMLMFQ